MCKERRLLRRFQGRAGLVIPYRIVSSLAWLGWGGGGAGVAKEQGRRVKLFTTWNVPFHAATASNGLKLGLPSAAAAAASPRARPDRDGMPSLDRSQLGRHVAWVNSRRFPPLNLPPLPVTAVTSRLRSRCGVLYQLCLGWEPAGEGKRENTRTHRRLVMRFPGTHTPQIIKTSARF